MTSMSIDIIKSEKIKTKVLGNKLEGKTQACKSLKMQKDLNGLYRREES